MYEYELYHHGVKGMKWGVRKKDRKNPNRMTRKQALAAYDDMDRKKEQYKIAKSDYNQSFNRAYNSGRGLNMFSKTKRLASDERWEDVNKKAEAVRTAKKDYKTAKKNIRENATVGQKMERGSKKAAAALGVIGSLYLADQMYTGGAGSKALGRAASSGMKAVKKKTMDRLFNASVLDASGKIIKRFNM
jgi:hypothetical protein